MGNTQPRPPELYTTRLDYTYRSACTQARPPTPRASVNLASVLPYSGVRWPYLPCRGDGTPHLAEASTGHPWLSEHRRV